MTRKKIAARSFQDGIVFYSNHLQGVGIRAFYDEDVLTLEPYCELLAEDELKTQKRLKIVNRILNSVLICLAFISGKFLFIHAAVFWALTGSKSFIALLDCAITFKKKDSRGFTIAKFHAAEHMAINAYQRLGRVPTCEEIEKESFFTELCGSRIHIRKIISSLIVVCFSVTVGIFSNFTSNTLDVFLFSVVMGIVFGLLDIFYDKKNLSMYFEIFFLSKPTNKEIQLAQFAIKQFDEMEKLFSELR